MAVVDTTGSSFVFQALFPFPYIPPLTASLENGCLVPAFSLVGILVLSPCHGCPRYRFPLRVR